MKKYVTKLMLIFVICVAIVSCDSGIMNYIPMPAELIPERAEFVPPTFLPIDNTEDIVVVANWRNQVDASELIAIDTKNSKVVQVCRIETINRNNYRIDSDSRFTDSGFCYFNLYPYTFCWNIKTGKTQTVNVERIGVLYMMGDNLVYCCQDSTSSFCYNPLTKKHCRINVSDSINSDICTIDGNQYCIYYNGYNSDSEVKTHSTSLRNITTNKNVPLHFESEPNKKFILEEIINNKYLITTEWNDVTTDETTNCYMYEIVSFEPENLIQTCIPECPNRIFEDDDYIYIANTSGWVKQISKTTKKVIAESEDLPESYKYIRGSVLEIKNGYAWFGASLNSGDFYRIELADDDGDGVLKWELFKNK